MMTLCDKVAAFVTTYVKESLLTFAAKYLAADPNKALREKGAAVAELMKVVNGLDRAMMKAKTEANLSKYLLAAGYYLEKTRELHDAMEEYKAMHELAVSWNELQQAKAELAQARGELAQGWREAGRVIDRQVIGF